jgi:alpha-beta hydrolase superfamily lysophospholipase
MDHSIKKRKKFKWLIWSLLAGFILLNSIAIIHSYKFTHFAESHIEKTQKPEKLSFGQKLKTLVFGVNNPRPVNKTKPSVPYETITLQSNRVIECWYIKKDSASKFPNKKGTIIICHGYGAEKSSMLDKAAIFDSLGYDTFLIDFMGSGGSEGNTTTIGYKEAKQVKTAYDYLKSRGAKNIYLFGTSMGAAAIMKAIVDDQLDPKGLILECPFGSMYKTVGARFRNMNVPKCPMAGLLVFWGGVQNGFWAFGHNPSTYARKIKCPVLLLYGEQDKNVTRAEIDAIYNNLGGDKILRTFELAGHENYLIRYEKEWTEDVAEFLDFNYK